MNIAWMLPESRQPIAYSDISVLVDLTSTRVRSLTFNEARGACSIESLHIVDAYIAAGYGDVAIEKVIN